MSTSTGAIRGVFPSLFWFFDNFVISLCTTLFDFFVSVLMGAGTGEARHPTFPLSLEYDKLVALETDS